MHTAEDWVDRERDWPNRARGMLERGRDWLDDRGRAAWIVAMIAGFLLFWPIGLGLLFYMIWSKRMSCNSWGRAHHHRHEPRSTGNAAFDAYRSETLKRLEDEREAFTSFLEQLRAAKDKAEFDQFMAARTPMTPTAS